MGITGSTYNPYMYAGTYSDDPTGFYQMGARYYRPEWGRFTQQDPLPRSVFEANRYHYTGNNPCNYTDPTGLFPIEPGCAISIGSTMGGAVVDYAPNVIVKGLGWVAGVGLGLWGIRRDIQDFEKDDAWSYVDIGSDVVSTGLTAVPVLDAPWGTVISSVASLYSCARSYGWWGVPKG